MVAAEPRGIWSHSVMDRSPFLTFTPRPGYAAGSHPVGVAGPGQQGLDDLGRAALLGRGGVPAAVEQQRPLAAALPELAHTADHDVVVATRVDGLDLASGPCQHAVEDRRAGPVGRPADAVELVWRGAAEPVGQVVLIF